MKLHATILIVLAFLCVCVGPVAVMAEPPWQESVDPSGIDVGEEVEDNLASVRSMRIDINTAGIRQLTELPGVSASDASLLVARRKLIGGFGSVREAASVEGLSPTAADALLAYAVVRPLSRKDWEVEAGIGASWQSDRLSSETPVRRVPDSMARIEARWLDHWSAYLLAIMKPGVSSVSAVTDGGLTGLVGRGPTVVVDPAGFGLSYERPGFRVVTGTFQVGFAAGLTMDTTGLRRPQGIHPGAGYAISGDSGSIRKQKRFSGAAVNFAVPVAAGRYRVSGSFFASYSFMDPSRNDIVYDRCPAGDPGCGDSEKALFITFSDPAAIDESTLGLTMTNALRECTAGGNVGFGTDRWQVEATGWATGLRFRPDAPSMAVSASSPMPEDRRIFGAAGLAGSTVLPGNGQFIAELAVNDRGATAAVVEAAFSPVQGLDLEPSLRYYPVDWDNPWTGSTADSREYRGNRTRNEIGGRFDLTWRSSRHTRNRLRLDSAWHPRDDTPETPPHLDVEAATVLEVFATSLERIAVEIGYRDQDVTRTGRGLSWEPYYSSSLGNLSGGCRIDWTLTVSTQRIPRSRLTAWVSQAIRDAATLADDFDIDMAATLRMDTNLKPGPAIAAFFRWSDQSMVDDDSPASGQGCASGWQGTVLPASCRGDSRLDAGLGLAQEFHAGKGKIRFSLSGRYTRHIDDRLSRQNDDETSTGPNEYAATCLVEFDFGPGVKAGPHAD